MDTKICSKCKVEKSFSEYFKDGKRKIGIRCKCKACDAREIAAWRDKNRSQYNNYAAMWRAKNPDRQHMTEIKRRYGMSLEQYNALLADQRNQCAICRAQHDPSRSRGRLYVDHDHETGKPRALLCQKCNTAIAFFNDDPVVISRAIAYLKDRTTP